MSNHNNLVEYEELDVLQNAKCKKEGHRQDATFGQTIDAPVPYT